MDRQGQFISPDIFEDLTERCIMEKDLRAGKEVGSLVVRCGLEYGSYVGRCLIRMFVYLGDMSEAKRAFNKISSPNVYAWTEIISGHVEIGLNEEAILMFQQMDEVGIQADGFIYVEVLRACSNIGALEEGKQIHSHIIENGFESNQFVGGVLLDMYCKHGCLEYSEMVFRRLPEKDVVTWSVLIAGLVQHEEPERALRAYQEMQEDGKSPDGVTFSSILQACLSLGDTLEPSKQVYGCIVRVGLEFDPYIGTSLMEIYAKAGKFEEAHFVFDKLSHRDLVSWSVLIACHAEHGNRHEAGVHGQEALRLFEQMQEEGLVPDDVMYVCALQACSSAAASEMGECIHVKLVERGMDMDLLVVNALIDMYGKCGMVSAADVMFQKMPCQDLVTWSALIAGHVCEGHGHTALQLFNTMQERGMVPNQVTFMSTLQACSCVAALEKGRQIHGRIIELGVESDILVANTLVDTYIKCGSMDDASRLFNRLPTHDIITWNILLSGHGRRSDSVSAAKCFSDLMRTPLEPTGTTYLNLLVACSHVGSVTEGCSHFKSMIVRSDIAPTLEHYTAMVALLGRGGCLNEAEDLLETMPHCPNAISWTSLLGSCKRHVNVGIARRCFDQLVAVEGRSAVGYALMSDILSSAGLVEEASKVEELRKCGNAWKKPAMAFIETGDQVHSFIVGDDSHPCSADIYGKLRDLSMSMKHEEGLVSQAASSWEEDALCGHSERLALAFGLISSPHGTSIRVAKNLRVCRDCHAFAGHVSRIEMREITIKDAYCIHHFVEGECCCKEHVSDALSGPG